jgi:hypothetical protein
MSHNHWIVINTYRSPTDDGFANSWSIWRCRTADERRRLLSEGLPYGSQHGWLQNADGSCELYVGTRGIRAATPAERRQALRDLERSCGLEPPFVDEYRTGLKCSGT